MDIGQHGNIRDKRSLSSTLNPSVKYVYMESILESIN